MKKGKIASCVLGNVSTNCYFIKNTQTGEVLIVDPADSPNRIQAMVEQLGAKPAAILLTHGHFDHILAAKEVRDFYGVPIYASVPEKRMLEDSTSSMTAFYGGGLTVQADHLLSDLDVVDLAGFRVQMLMTPGHTKGSCCYYISEEEVLFSGDTLFAGSCGRTDFPGGSGTEMRASLNRLFSSLPDETTVYPGHGESTTIGYEKRYNPFA